MTFLATLLNNELLPELRKEILKHLGDKDFLKCYFLSKSTVCADTKELKERMSHALDVCMAASKIYIDLEDTHKHIYTQPIATRYMRAKVDYQKKRAYQKKLRSSYSFVKSWQWRKLVCKVLKNDRS